jgi:hypothetical protein
MATTTDPRVQEGMDALKASAKFEYDYINFTNKQPIPDNFIKYVLSLSCQ